MYHHGAKWAAASDMKKKEKAHSNLLTAGNETRGRCCVFFSLCAERKYCRRELRRLAERCHTDTRGIIREKQMEAVIH